MFAVLSGRKSREGGRRPGRKQVYERKALIRLLIYIGTILLTAAAGYWFVCGFATKEAVMDDSMEPTLQSEDIVLVNKAAYKVGKSDSMDVALIRIGQSGSGPVYIRRIVGVPGDTVKITDGKLYVNDEQVELPGNGDAKKPAQPVPVWNSAMTNISCCATITMAVRMTAVSTVSVQSVPTRLSARSGSEPHLRLPLEEFISEY